MVWKPTPDNQQQQWPSLPTCYCTNFGEDLRPPVTDWAKATRQHKELGQNLQLLLRTWEMQVAQEESCLAVEEWEGREKDSAMVIRVHGHELMVEMASGEIPSSMGPLLHDPSLPSEPTFPSAPPPTPSSTGDLNSQLLIYCSSSGRSPQSV